MKVAIEIKVNHTKTKKSFTEVVEKIQEQVKNQLIEYGDDPKDYYFVAKVKVIAMMNGTVEEDYDE